MFPLSPTTWIYIAVGVLIAGLSVAVKVQTSRLDSCKSEFALFQAKVEVLGKEAEAKAKAKELSDKTAKEKADETAKKLLADNADLGRRLRNARASSSFVPAAAPGTHDTSRACFDRTKLESAIQQLDAGVQGLISQGDAWGLRLSTAQEWAKSVGSLP